MEDNLELLRYPIGRYQRPEHFTPELKTKWLTEIEVLPSLLEISLENLDHAQLEQPYRPGGWSSVQVVHHIADSHLNAFVRLKLTLTENNPTVKTFNENKWAETPEVFNVPVNVSTTLLHALHRRWVSALKSMSDDQWLRTFHHPEQNRDIPIWELTALYAWHGRHHVEQIRHLRQRMNW